ncbi:hypothetical protein BZY95_01615 [Billgrantia desiderata SP1]|nr:hypothetical protein BZY95_01615 [Halomonas desiderata SP1]
MSLSGFPFHADCPCCAQMCRYVSFRFSLALLHDFSHAQDQRIDQWWSQVIIVVPLATGNVPLSQKRVQERPPAMASAFVEGSMEALAIAPSVRVSIMVIMLRSHSLGQWV